MYAIADYLRELSEDSFLDVYLADRNSVQREADRMVSNDIVFLELGFGLVFFFASAYLFRPSLAKCKSHFAIVSIVASKKSMSLKYRLDMRLCSRFRDPLCVWSGAEFWR